VRGQPNLLLVEGRAGDARNLGDALAAARFKVTTLAPAAMPTDQASLCAFDAVVLVDVPLYALPAETAALLPTYVHELGHGLAMVGGSRSLGAGGYRDAVVGNIPPGAYQVELVATQADGQPFAAIDAGAVLPHGSEYRGSAGASALLASLARITGGRIDPAPASVYDPTRASGGVPHDLAPPLLWLALALLPIDVGIRRLSAVHIQWLSAIYMRQLRAAGVGKRIAAIVTAVLSIRPPG
jgi:hypothetical protein